LVRVAIADSGIGIWDSFRLNDSPHLLRIRSHLDAVQVALEPKVSSTDHLGFGWGQSVNAGVGLTLLKNLSVLMKGSFVLASQSGICSLAQAFELPDNSKLNGTLCPMSFQRSRLSQFADLLYMAKQQVGLISTDDDFPEMFE
jgi:hypothetical protein